jgi:hypothetical protein
MVRVVPGCSFRAQMPRTLRDLLAVRTRVHRGNRQLLLLAHASGNPLPAHAQPQGMRNLLSTARRRPDLWAGLLAYVAVNVVAKLRARRQSASWGRDESSRRARMTGRA